MQIYIHRNNQQLGPFTEAEIKAQLASGTISPQDHVWYQGLANWMPLSASPLAAGTPPGAPPIASAVPAVPGPGLPAEKTSNLALWSMICGISGFFCGITCIPAIILGHMGLSETKKNPAIKGRGMALAGVILGYVCVAFLILYISIVGISVLIALGNQVKKVSDEKTLVPDQSTNSPDQSTNSADQSSTAPAATPNSHATTNSPDQTVVVPQSNTNSPDTTSSPPATNSSDTSTNSAPMNQ